MEAYSGLITGGLGLPACRGLIPMRFHLFAEDVPVTSGVGSGGGSYPLKPGSIQNFYQPVDKPKIPLDTYDEPHYVRVENDPRPKQVYKIVVQFGDKQYDKTVMLTRKGRAMVFTAVSFANITIERINAVVSGFKRITTNVKIIASRFKRKQ